MYLVLFLMTLPILIVVIAIPLEIINYFRDTSAQAPQACSDAWEMYDAVMEEENKKARERDYLTALIANLEDLQRIAERGERDEKQLRKIIALDKQIHAAQSKLEKLG